MKHPNSGKYKHGCGGKLCPCCTKVPHNERKIAERRANRHKDKINLAKMVE